jgi:hypothetical protein
MMEGSTRRFQPNTMIIRLLTIILVALAPLAGTAQTTITIGETATLGYADNGNGNLLSAQNAYLAQTATVRSLSFYVVSASKKLRLGIFDATGPGGGPGKLMAQTQAFTTSPGEWNTAAVITPVTLAPAMYWLAYLPQSSNLSFRKGYSSGVSARYYKYPFASLPATFYTHPKSDTAHWSFYATLTTGPTMPTLLLSFNPPNPSIPANTSLGSVVATITPTWSDGSPFTGTLSFAQPYSNDNGVFAMSGSNLIINPSGPGVSTDANTVQDVTIVATQRGE